MKKILILAFWVMVLGLQSCNEEKASARQSLKASAMMENKVSAGTYIDSETICDKVEFSNDQYHVYFIISKSLMDQLTYDRDDIERGLYRGLLSNNSALIGHLMKISGKFVYHFKCIDTGKQDIIEFEF